MAVNQSEAFLETLARKSFLSMWSYSNLMYGDPASRKASKELCDLFVVFRNNIILFSDKSCNYPDSPDEQLNWSRWYKRSVKKSVDQLLGAKKTLLHAPRALFTDSKRLSPFPLELPLADTMRIFLVAVTHGSSVACVHRFGRSSLKIDTRIASDEKQLSVGVRFGDDFVHILDDSTVEIVLNKLDTIVDFVSYLEKKENALSMNDFIIDGEENLLASYLAHRDYDGEHIIPLTRTDSASEPILIKNGLWNEYITSDSCKQTIESNKISYNIDKIIEHFTHSYADGQMILGQNEPLAYHETGFRDMASENRLSRRAICTSFMSIYNEENTKTFWACTAPSLVMHSRRYVFVTYPQKPLDTELDSYEQYVLEYLSQHIIVARYLFPSSKTLIGIAVPNRDCKMLSYFTRVLDGENWTQEDDLFAIELQKRNGIFVNMEAEHYIHFE